MPNLPEPQPIPARIPTPPRGWWPVRAARAVLVEHRLPTAMQTAAERLLIRAGWPCRTLVVPDIVPDTPPDTAGAAHLRVRRLTSDAAFVQEVFCEQAYLRPGYAISPAEVVVDVGGNIGTFAVYAGRRALQGRVISVEPFASSVELLQANLARNSLPHVTTVHAAVAATSGTATLHLSPHGTGQHSLDRTLAGHGGESTAVASVSLTDLFCRFDLPRCDLLKLDCEGAEFEILETLPQGTADRIRRIVLEYHTRPAAPKRTQSDALARRLMQLGYRVDAYEDHLETNRGMLFVSRDRGDATPHPSAVIDDPTPVIADPNAMIDRFGDVMTGL